MDIFTYLENNGGVLDGTILVHIFIFAIIIELFGLCSYWLRRF